MNIMTHYDLTNLLLIATFPVLTTKPTTALKSITQQTPEKQWEKNGRELANGTNETGNVIIKLHCI